MRKIMIACLMGLPCLLLSQKYEVAFLADGEARTNLAAVKVKLTKQVAGAATIQSMAAISPTLQTPQGWDFVAGVQSPINKHVVYLECITIGKDYNVYEFDPATQEKKLLFNQSTAPEKDYAFKPIAWSAEKNTVYFEKFRVYSDLGHEGIWAYNINTHKAIPLSISSKYFSTPILSPDGQSFLYTKTNDVVKNNLHGVADEICVYEIATGKEITIIKNKDHAYQVTGWLTEAKGIAAPTNEIISNSAAAAAVTVNYRLPWNATGGTSGYYVSRHGTPAPTLSHTPTGPRITDFDGIQQHGYAAIDFATSPTSDQIVRASASGTVVFAGDCGVGCGYGNLVVIKHDDGLHTYYGHFKTIFVQTGACVGLGQSLGYEGTTGQSSGDHIHFEWRDANRNAALLKTFADVGQPRQGYFYVSTTPIQSCGDFTAPTTSIAAVGGTTQSANFTANFTDADNVGVQDRFYQVLELRGNEFRANRGNGFYNDNYDNQSIHSDYTYGGTGWNGTWAETTTGRLRQSNTTLTNTAIFTSLSQTNGNTYLYNFAAKLNNTTGSRRFGLHIMGSNNTERERGNAYLVWFSADDNRVRIIESNANVLTERTSAVVGTTFTNFNDYKAIYNTTTGTIKVYINNIAVLSWTDATPLTGGTYISFRTNQADVEFDDLKVYKNRSASKLITVGSANSNDARVASVGTTPSCKIKSLVNDAAGNWSAVGNLDMILNFTAASATTTDAMEAGVLITNTVYPTFVTDGLFAIRLHTRTLANNKTIIQLYDANGNLIKELHNGNVNGSVLNFNVSNLSLKSGFYFVSVQADQGKRQTTKLIIQ
jgi:murein DD-endopeptidase MepM/ murein hydrolase activator NlpD